MICAAKLETTGTSWSVGHSTLPTLWSEGFVSLAGKKRRTVTIPEVPRVDAGEKDGRVDARDGPWHLHTVDLERCRVTASARGNQVARRGRDAHRTTPTPSPGKAASSSPTWTMPLSTLPETARPDDVALWPRKTFETGIRRGASRDLGGTSRRSEFVKRSQIRKRRARDG